MKSSIAAGTPLKGLNFEKNKVDPVALADEEYPEWLWTILSRQEKSSDGVGMGDLFCELLCLLNTLGFPHLRSFFIPAFPASGVIS